MKISQFKIERGNLHYLFDQLQASGYQIIGPKRREEAILYEELESIEELPIGWIDRHEAGQYFLEKREDAALFGYNSGAHTWKKFLHPPSVKLWSADREKEGFRVSKQPENPPKYALLGVRSCELNAILIQDKVFLESGYENATYRAIRENALIIAVNCGQANQTCFCVSMDAGPQVKSGFDLALTEIIKENEHYFIAESGSEKGKAILAQIPCREAQSQEVEEVGKTVAKAEAQMGRAIHTEGIKELLYRNYDHKRWEEVADRCLTCGNCTMMCPTCFCTTVEDVTDLTFDHAERWQHWDSCFTLDFSYIHGHTVRSSTKSRYRQWMTHKLATWIDQFGTSGCVGCGNCITWCPVGIDITEEVKAIQESEKEIHEICKI